jgi:hypothetical protein
MRGSTVLEKSPIDPKATFRALQERRPVPDGGLGAHNDSWHDIDPDVYSDASVLFEGEQKFTSPSADSKQAITPQNPFIFSSLLPPPPATLERDVRRSRVLRSPSLVPSRACNDSCFATRSVLVLWIRQT